MSTLVRLTAVFTVAAIKNATIHLDFETNLSATSTDVGNMAAAGVSGWNGAPNLRGSFATGVVLKQVEAYAYDLVANPSPPPAFRRQQTADTIVSTSGVAGSVATGQLPPNVAVVASHKTATFSRRGRGRVYLPPLPEGSVNDDGVLGAAFKTALNTAWNSWVVGIQNSVPAGQTATHSVVSLTGGTVSSVTSRVVKGRVDTQRRRLSRLLDV